MHLVHEAAGLSCICIVYYIYMFLFHIRGCEVEFLTADPLAPAVDVKRVAESKLTELQLDQENSESDSDGFVESWGLQSKLKGGLDL